MRFFETIKAKDGKIFHLPYHNRRLNKTIYENFGIKSDIDLAPLLQPPAAGLYRVKVIYSTKIEEILYYPYTPSIPKSFTLVESSINYRYKYLDRSKLEELLQWSSDEIIICKKGLLTDTSKANIALFINDQWLTPSSPLLAGTTRARLLEEKKIKEAKLTIKDLQKCQKIALMNAMIDFYEINDFTIKDSHAL